MTTAAVVYLSATGTTRRYAEAIGAELTARGIDTRVASIEDCDPATIAGTDLVLLGCWTQGLFIVGQHPDVPWVSFARDLPDLGKAKVALFATYKVRTGSMFRRMREALAPSHASVSLQLASRHGTLSEADRRALEAWVGA
jgi:flavodoxin